MKILFFITELKYGGAEKIMAALANHMSVNNDVTLLAYTGDSIMQPLSDKVKFKYNPLYRHSNKIIEILGQVRALRKYIKENEFDLCVSFLYPSSLRLVMASRGLNCKVLLSERCDPNEILKSGKWFEKLILKIMQNADAYVFQTADAAKCYSKKAQKKSMVIANPIPDKTIPAPYTGEREKIIVTASRMDMYQKRQDVLIKAFAKIADKYPEYILRLYGDGPDIEKIMEIAKGTGYSDRIEFMGLQKNILSEINSASLFVLSSDFEGIPNALLEAMAAGLPCISTDCSPGGARVLIDHGQNGLITPCGDVDALAEAMEKVLTDREFANKISLKATEVTDKFSKEIIFSKWERFMTDILSK